MRLVIAVVLLVGCSFVSHASQSLTGMKTQVYNASIVFFGLPVDIPYDPRLESTLLERASSASIATWVETVAKSDLFETVQFINNTVEKYNLNDWGKFLLVEKFAYSIHSKAGEQKLLTWFLMRQLGYNFRVGYATSGVIWIMIGADVNLYNKTYYTFNGIKYYVMDSIGNSNDSDMLFSYSGLAPAADKIIKFKNMKSPLLPLDKVERQLVFREGRKGFTANFVINKNIIDYYNTMPQSDHIVYTTAETSDGFNQQSRRFLSEITGEKQALDVVATVLLFVQSSFPYMQDEKQFSREKFMFPEEVLYYPYSDCEDRSILFSYFVSKITGRSVVLLEYPDHIAAAVETDTSYMNSFEYKGKLYTYADPTCMICGLGTVMPNFVKIAPIVVETVN